MLQGEESVDKIMNYTCLSKKGTSLITRVCK